MLFTTIAVAALAGHAVAVEGAWKPYKPALARMSAKDMLLGRRQEDGGYQPDTTFCGTGTTCAEACGAGYEQCASADDQVHCYDAGSSQTCCPNNTGDSCDAGYYCSADTTGESYCCPDGSSVEDCAVAFSVTGGLSSQVPVATSTSSAGTYSTISGTTTISSTSTIVLTSTISVTSTNAAASTTAATTSSTTGECTTYTSEVVYTIVPVSGTVGYNTTTAKGTGSLPTSSTAAATTTTVPVQAGASTLQMSPMVAVAAVVLAALF